MELPFYLRILPPEALEILAYFRRLNHNIANTNGMMLATGLSERGFGKAIRRLVTKGYLVLDGDQHYRLTEHGQRAVDDLPDSVGVRGELSAAPPEIEHVPVDNTDTFESLFTESSLIETTDSLFDEQATPNDVEAVSFLAESSFEDDSDAIARLFDSNASEEDDLFAEMNDEDAAAFNELFGGADENAEPAVTLAASDERDDEAEPETPIDPAATTEHNAVEPEAPAITTTPETNEAVSLEDLFAGMDEAPPAAAPESKLAAPEFTFEAASADGDGLFEWLELDESPADEHAELWGNLEIAESAPAAETSSQIIERQLMVALPQPLVAEQPAHVTIGILPGNNAALAEPVALRVRLAVLNGEPSSAQEFPLLLGNGLARQDVTITPGRYQQVRLRVHVYQNSDDAGEAILCGGLYVDADVVDEPDSRQTPVAFGTNTHFVLSP